MTKSEIFKKAWAIARETRGRHPTTQAAFAAALRATYAALKAPRAIPVFLSEESIEASRKAAAVAVAKRRVAREGFNVVHLTGAQRDRAVERLAAARASLAEIAA